jgi:hypothetical protein
MRFVVVTGISGGEPPYPQQSMSAFSTRNIAQGRAFSISRGCLSSFLDGCFKTYLEASDSMVTERVPTKIESVPARQATERTPFTLSRLCSSSVVNYRCLFCLHGPTLNLFERSTLGSLSIQRNVRRDHIGKGDASNSPSRAATGADCGWEIPLR